MGGISGNGAPVQELHFQWDTLITARKVFLFIFYSLISSYQLLYSSRCRNDKVNSKSLDRTLVW